MVVLLLVAEWQNGWTLPAWTLADWGRMGYATLLGSAMAYGLFFWFANRRDLTTFSSLGSDARFRPGDGELVSG